MAVLLALFLASNVLSTVVIFSLSSRNRVTQMEVCHLYVVLHASDITVVIPPQC
jgi:hypothetical protein